MPLRRAGNPTSLWNNSAASAGSVSGVVELARKSSQIAFYLTVSAATLITLESAHSGGINPDGTSNDTFTPDWGQVYYIDTPLQINFTASGSVTWIIPDFEPGWVRLRTSNAVTISAGHEVTSR